MGMMGHLRSLTLFLSFFHPFSSLFLFSGERNSVNIFFWIFSSIGSVMNFQFDLFELALLLISFYCYILVCDCFQFSYFFDCSRCIGHLLWEHRFQNRTLSLLSYRRTPFRSLCLISQVFFRILFRFVSRRYDDTLGSSFMSLV